MEEIALHDHRRTFHFWLDDALFDTYGHDLGPLAITVYAYLARKAKSNASFPAHRTIAHNTGMSRDSVMRALKKLVEKQLITIDSRLTDSGDKDTNLYAIQDLSHLHTQQGHRGSSPQQQPCSPQQQGSSSGQQGVVADSNKGSSPQQHKGFSLKDSHLKEEKKDPLIVPPLPQKSRKPTPTNSDAQTVLDYLNTTHHRTFQTSTQIQALLRTGVTVDDCKLVIDWLFAVERLENPDGYEKYGNNVTPFRPQNFDRNLDRARRWKQQLHTPKNTNTHTRVVL